MERWAEKIKQKSISASRNTGSTGMEVSEKLLTQTISTSGCSMLGTLTKMKLGNENQNFKGIALSVYSIDMNAI